MWEWEGQFSLGVYEQNKQMETWPLDFIMKAEINF